MFRLFNGQATNGNSVTFNPKSYVPDGGLNMELFVTGTFGGGSAQLQQSPDGGTTWFNVDTPLTAAGRQVVTVFSPIQLRLALTGATSPNLNAWISNTGNF